MSVSGQTAVYAVLGRPVGHSASPALHNAWFVEHGVDAVYVALDVPPERAGDVIGALRVLGLAGANLTVPLKEAALPHLDAVEGLAGTLGAVNTVVRDGERWVGFNTDAEGFVDGLREELDLDPHGARAVVLGAGGAGVAVGAGLLAAGAASVTWLNRTPARAEAAAARCAGVGVGARDHGPLTPDAFAAAVSGADVVVQATSGAGRARVAGFDPSAVPASAVWSELNYWDADPPLATALRARGVRFQDGRAMLAHQAARAFRHFTGILPDAATARRRIG